MSASLSAAIYLRISSDDDLIGDSNSIKGQRELLTSYVKKHLQSDYADVIEIVDDGYSGTSFERPGVKRLLEMVRQGKVKCIIVKDFSRFGRNYIEVGDYLEQIFPFLGVRFVSVVDNYDSSDAACYAGDIGVAFKNLIHDYYAKDISRKIRSAMKVKMEHGYFISAYAIFGYTKSAGNRHKLSIDEQATSIVRYIYDLILSGKSTTQTAFLLNAEGLPTPNVYKSRQGCNRSWTYLS